MNVLQDIGDHYQRALHTMGDSGVHWVDVLFKMCVVALVDLAHVLGISYEAINIWIFVIIWPSLTVFGALWILVLKFKLRMMSR
jgi:hypothetical protein|tara:strand:+ start:785 stop:1036 length:252 start_codon:yes stop_codon:yes gene_type:complete